MKYVVIVLSIIMVLAWGLFALEWFGADNPDSRATGSILIFPALFMTAIDAVAIGIWLAIG